MFAAIMVSQPESAARPTVGEPYYRDHNRHRQPRMLLVQGSAGTEQDSTAFLLIRLLDKIRGAPRGPECMLGDVRGPAALDAGPQLTR